MSLSATTPEGAVEALKSAGIRTVHIGILDVDSCFRERRVPVARAIAALQGAYTFPNVLPRWDTGESVYDPDLTYGDEDAMVDPTSGRAYPFEADAALFIADYAGPSAALSARRLLACQVERARRLGFTAKAAMECEFTVLAETAESVRAKGFAGLAAWAPDNRCFAGDSAATYAGFVADLDGLAGQLGIPLHGLGTELGPGCLEATLLAQEPMKAADDFALFRGFTKSFCRRRGLTASFMAQLGDGFQGLSGHLHLSLVDAKGGKSAFADAIAPDGISATMRHFIGGLLRLLPETIALCTHTANAYRRMAPGNWSPRTPTWGVRNYSVAVCASAVTPATTRIEFRVPAADTNPHLAMAMALGAGLWGIETRAEPPPPATGNARDLVPEGFQPFPRTLAEAADRLDASRTARTLFGDAFIDHFVATRRHEDAVLRRHVSAFERARYLEAL
ncbi:MAG: glutamine synthetase [Alphaproteobacteria bacterium]|nr:glutamine synthetase [Alphaproteobacteria bacterium]